MKTRSVMMLGVALVMGVGAAWVANNWLRMRVLPTAEAATTPVVVAALKIPYGQKIEAAHVKLVKAPDGVIPEGALRELPQAVGKVANQALFPGEILIGERVVEQLGGSTLSAMVAPRMRAVTVRVNDVIGVAGFLLPGNRVDIVATRSEGNQASARTILQDLKVLAVDQTAAPEKDKPLIVRAVTLEMSPEQAELLVKATTEGAVQLTLRNPGDSAIVAQKPEVKPVAAPQPVPVASSGYSVTLIRGTKVDSEKAGR